MTPDQFAEKIKAKYPEYKDWDNTELTNKILNKYPQYESKVKMPEADQTSEGVLPGTTKVLNTVFGGGTIGEFMGTQLAKGTFGKTLQTAATGREMTPEQEQEVGPGPSGKSVAGDVLRTAATFLPVGKIAGGVSKGLAALGLTKGASVAGQAVAGGLTGLAADTGLSMEEGGGARAGLGTAIGAGLPIVGPVASAVTRAAAKISGKGASEIGGALTGTSAETLEQAFAAARQGGDELEQFTAALRGKTTPEKLVNNLRDKIGFISSQRQTLFKNTLKELGDEVVDATAAKTTFADYLSDAKVAITNGQLDFSNSGKLKLVPQAQNKIALAFQEVSQLPDNATLEMIDDTRQAIKALKLTGDDPSANLANKLIDDAVRAVREVGENVPGYGQMLDEFAETSEFLEELGRGLSTGGQATVDQTYRRMATALKTNNEQRMALVRELDQATDGAILSSIAGQQLSEALPRGIFRQIGAGIAGGAAITGGISVNLLPPLVFASPRVAGEFVRALGIGATKAKVLTESINTVRNTLIKIGAISGAVQDSGNDE